MLKMATAFQFAHEANIKRYERLLQTHLTAHERAFVKRRLQEEQAALKSLYERDVSVDSSDR